MCRSSIFCLGCVLVVAAFVSASASPKESPKKIAYQVISYNFLNTEIDTSNGGDLTIRYQHAMRLKVLNFNPFLYDLTINGQTVSNNQNFPALLTAALAGNAPKPEEIASEVSAIVENLKVTTVQQLKVREQAQNKIKEYQDARKTFQAALSDVYLKLPTAETIVLESVGFSDDLTKEKLLSQIKQRQNILCNAENPDALRDILSPVIDRPRPAWADLNDAFRGLADDAKKLLQDDFDAEKSRWLVFQGTDEAVFKKALNNAISTWSGIEEANFEIWGGPFFAIGDELIINVTASRKAGLDAHFPTNRTCSEKPIVRLRVRGGFKLDFSTGFVFGWPADKVYDLRKNANSENIIVESQENQGFVAVTPAMFLHVYPRKAQDFAVAGTLGLAMNKSTIFDYYIGASALFGASQRGVFTLGIGMRTITRLSGKYQVNDVLPAEAGSIPLVNVLHFAIFLGLSFNLGGI